MWSLSAENTFPSLEALGLHVFPNFSTFLSTYQFGEREEGGGERKGERRKGIRAVGAGLPSPLKPEEFYYSLKCLNA